MFDRARSTVPEQSLLGVGSQVVSSLRSLATVVITARALDESVFADVAIVLTAVIVINEVLRALISHPVALADATTDGADERPFLGAVSATVMVAGPLAVGGGILAMVAGEPVLAVGAFGYLAVAVHDGVRIGALNRGVGRRALTIDLLWLVALIVALPLGLAASATGTTALVVWAGTALLATTITLGVARLAPSVGAARAHLARHIDTGAKLVGQVLLEQIPARLVALLLGVVVARETVGSIRGAELLFGATTVATSGLGLVALRESRARQSRGQHESALRYLVTIAGIGLAFAVGNLLVVKVLPDSVGEALLGETWAGADHYALAVGGLLMALLLAGVASIGLRGALRHDLVTRVAALAAAGSVLGASVAAATTGPRAALAAAAVAVGVSALLGWGYLWRELGAGPGARVTPSPGPVTSG